MTIIHDTLAPLVRALGIKETARRTGINRLIISRWLSGRSVNESKGYTEPCRLNEQQIEDVAKAVGAKIVCKPPRKSV